MPQSLTLGGPTKTKTFLHLFNYMQLNQTQLFVEVVLSVWILGTALLMRSAANSKPVVKEATADTE